ncbi:MAG: hypothetical protein HXX12_04025 [Geothrix sp.]|uniref:hypothetical protein n=1 Tax=Geothrix sp. TaxID=1962974 RepID=UPI0017C8B306|nr:hypothetical protein [Geothrix sp.]NWJ40121.1 hypothetical protein [Geothrix sp.]WIL21870.1 MAG: hypothetical protein QOZ81_001145 [Geothrix sp.]
MREIPIPPACVPTMESVLVDPVDPGPEAEAHLKICRACSEVRVAYLAQEESPEALAPAGYFERLPERILRKLPARPRLHLRVGPFAWGAAAALLMAVGAGAFWAGRANRTPLVEATLPRTPSEVQEVLPETPFQDPEDAVSQLTALSQQEADAVLRILSDRQAQPPAKK